MNGTDAATAAVTPLTSASLAPGFRFHPTDEELVSYYLKRKVAGRPLRVDAIAEVDLYRREPWELPSLSRIRSGDMEWYFFSPLDRKHSNGGRTNRTTAKGYWKTTGKDRSVLHGPRVVGKKKILVFHTGRAPRGARTNWVMHEYRLAGEGRLETGLPQDAYVVCKIFQKNGAGPQKEAQCGAPFVEEEWEDEAAGQLDMMNEGCEDDCTIKCELLRDFIMIHKMRIAQRFHYDPGNITLEIVSVLFVSYFMYFVCCLFGCILNVELGSGPLLTPHDI